MYKYVVVWVAGLLRVSVTAPDTTAQPVNGEHTSIRAVYRGLMQGSTAT